MQQLEVLRNACTKKGPVLKYAAINKQDCMQHAADTWCAAADGHTVAHTVHATNSPNAGIVRAYQALHHMPSETVHTSK